jgi:IS30 family transposase
MARPTPEEIAERRALVAQLSAEHDVPTIARMLGVCERTVTRDRVEMKVARPAPRKFTSDDHARAEALIADGCSLREVARTMDRSVSVIDWRFTGRSHWRGNIIGNGRHARLKERLGL